MINPNLTQAHRLLGGTLISSGQPKEELAALETCIRLDPRAPRSAAQLMLMTMGLYFSCEYERCADRKEGIRSFPDFPNHYRWLAAALGKLGRSEEAKEALEKAIAFAPGSFDFMCAGDRPGFGRKTTPIWSMVCARPGCRQ
jgi:adenylate cyclase